jgi:uncharacterized protein (TIGR02270 family)
MSSSFIHFIIQQHAEESAILRNTRSRLLRAPHIRLPQLSHFDERLAAHLDGLAVAGEVGSRLCEAELETQGVGRVFAASVRAIEERDEKRLDRLFALVEAVPDSLKGLTSAFGWVAADYLRGLVRALLDSDQPLRQSVGLAACAMHQVDPGPALAAAVADSDAGLRARALRTVGVCGRQDLMSACQEAAVQDDDPSCRFWAGWSAVLLGDRGRALAQSAEYIHQPGPFRDASMQIVLRAMDIQRGLDCLKRLAQDAAGKRELIQGAGTAGDPYYAEWLLGQMENPVFARLAGESFSSITGLDFAHPDFNGKAPENFESGPSDDPEDDNVAIDPDEDLPWPDHQKAISWWKANKNRFADGAPHFLGEPVRIDHCRRVLHEGYQRQRRAAALFLSLLQPGTVLFNTSAPAWRQRHLLEAQPL